MRLPSPAARITTDRGSWVRPPPLRSGAKEWLGFLATLDALPLAAGGDKRDSPPDRDGAGLGLGRAQAKLAELAAHEGPHVHLGIRMRLVLGILSPRHERGGPVRRLLEGCAPGEGVIEEGLAERGEVPVVLAGGGRVGSVGGGGERRDG